MTVDHLVECLGKCNLHDGCSFLCFVNAHVNLGFLCITYVAVDRELNAIVACLKFGNLFKCSC